ncbi:unannotated protein [freshwater metagenome]|uniref:Unannotated protein n=1 Tax=freshwater metagenome TaxID=449393 RepID=A0A6J6ZV85_9ZZZZ
MQRSGVPVEPLSTIEQASVVTVAIHGWHGGGAVVDPTQFLGHLLATAARAVQVEYQILQPDPLEATDHCVDRCALLRDEQHAAPASAQRRDQVGDGLRLAGAGRALDHEVGAIDRSVDRIVL